MSIQAMRERRAALAKELRNLVDKNPGNAWNADHQKTYDETVAEIDRIDAEIERTQRALDVEAQNAQRIEHVAQRDNIGLGEAANRVEQERGIFTAWLRGGANALTNEQLQYVAARAREVRNTMSTGTGAEGGFLVPQEFARQLSEVLKAFGGMRTVATVIQTATGASMDWPNTDATSEVGEIVGENVQVGSQDATFGTKSLDTYKFSSKTIAIPFELLQDSAIDLEGHINNRIRDRLGRIQNQVFTTGTGTGQPTGIITAAAAGKVGAAGQTTSVTTDDLVDLEHSVDPAYRASGKCGFMLHDQTLKALKKLKDAQNRPLWLPGISMKEPDTILGYGYTINQDMAQMAANALSIAFGDFSRYIIRDVMQVMLFRLTDSKYTEKGQVGFLAFMRAGGNLTDIGGAVKTYQNAAA